MTTTEQLIAAVPPEEQWRVVTPTRVPLRRRGEGKGFQVAIQWPMLDCAGARLADRSEHVRLAKQLEDIGVDYAAIPEATAGAGLPVSQATWPANLTAVQVILATRTLGVVSAQRTSYVHPVHLARTGSHLDWLSGGRWGGWIDPVRTDAEDRLMGWAPEPGAPLERAEASHEAMKTIWATAKGVAVDLENAHFRIRGSVKYPQVIQDAPFTLISEPGIEALQFAAKVADHYVASAGTLAELTNFAGQALEAAATADRTTPLRVLAHVALGFEDVELSASEGLIPLTGDTALLGSALGQIAELGDVGGVLIELADWSKAGVDRFAFVLDRLRANNLWTSSADRGYTW